MRAHAPAHAASATASICAFIFWSVCVPVCTRLQWGLWLLLHVRASVHLGAFAAVHQLGQHAPHSISRPHRLRPDVGEREHNQRALGHHQRCDAHVQGRSVRALQSLVEARRRGCCSGRLTSVATGWADLVDPAAVGRADLAATSQDRPALAASAGYRSHRRRSARWRSPSCARCRGPIRRAGSCTLS